MVNINYPLINEQVTLHIGLMDYPTGSKSNQLDEQLSEPVLLFVLVINLITFRKGFLLNPVRSQGKN